MSSHSEPNRSPHLSAPVTSHRGEGDRRGPAERRGWNERSDTGGNGSWGDTPNPFSRVLAASEPSAKSRFVRAAKTLVVTLALTALLIAGVFFGKQFLLAQLVDGFDELDAAAKQNRLSQIADFGSDAIEPLVAKLIATEDAVSASAFALLQKLQNDWIMLPTDEARTEHHRLIRAIAATFCPPLKPGQSAGASEQTAQSNPLQRSRASQLLRQSILEFSSAPADSGELLAAANQLLSELNVRARPQPMLVESPVKLGTENSAHSVAKVVQLSSPVRQSGWTDWPPARAHTAQIVRSGTRQANFDENGQLNSSIAAPATLQALPPGVMAPLRPITQRDANTAKSTDASPDADALRDTDVSRDADERCDADASQDANTPVAPILKSRHRVGRVIQVAVDSEEKALARRSDAALIEQLASLVPKHAARARAELIERGFSTSQVELARNWSMARPEERVQLVGSLAHSGDLVSAQWLPVALGDPDREVRLQVASALENSQDADVLNQLRQQLARETDPHVAYRIRRILDLF